MIYIPDFDTAFTACVYKFGGSRNGDGADNLAMWKCIDLTSMSRNSGTNQCIRWKMHGIDLIFRGYMKRIRWLAPGNSRWRKAWGSTHGWMRIWKWLNKETMIRFRRRWYRTRQNIPIREDNCWDLEACYYVSQGIESKDQQQQPQHWGQPANHVVVEHQDASDMGMVVQEVLLGENSLSSIHWGLLLLVQEW